MATSLAHNPAAITKKVYFDISIGGQPEGEALAGQLAGTPAGCLQETYEVCSSSVQKLTVAAAAAAAAVLKA
jgi:hypothetical protein